MPSSKGIAPELSADSPMSAQTAAPHDTERTPAPRLLPTLVPVDESIYKPSAAQLMTNILFKRVKRYRTKRTLSPGRSDALPRVLPNLRTQA